MSAQVAVPSFPPKASQKPGLEETIAPKEHRIRITLTSRLVKSLESVCSRLLQSAKSKDVAVKGPVRMPTKVLHITTRKTPCGEGSKTWDRYELRIHKRVIDFKATAELVKEITNLQLESGVDVEVIIADD